MTRSQVTAGVAGACLMLVGVLSTHALATATIYPVGMEFAGIQEAIDVAEAGSTIAISSGTYAQNLLITKSLRLVGLGGVTIRPADRSAPAIRVLETRDVGIYDIQVESADYGIEVSRSSCSLSGCSIRASVACVEIAAFDTDAVLLTQCVFEGDRVGLMALGDGTIEVSDCGFKALGTGTLLAGLTSVLVRGCQFLGCYDSIGLASSVKGTLIGNRIEDSHGRGIRVAPAPDPLLDGPLVIVDNVIASCGQWAISLCDVDDPEMLTFAGLLVGSGNAVDGGADSLCPTDYSWPEGFLVTDVIDGE